MHRVLTAVATFAAFIVLFGCADTGGKKKDAAQSDDPSEEASADESESSGEPDGAYRLASCANSGTKELVGSVRVQNEGDVPLTATIPFAWELDDGSTIEAEPETVDLEPGSSKLVFFSQDVGINTILKFQGHPGYFNSKNCASKVEISG